jgi:hypothetical protein
MAISKITLVAGFLIFLATFSLGYFPIGTVASPASPSVSMEQHLYTRLNKDAYLKGTGFASGTYYVWTGWPNQNSTRYSGIAFQTSADGSIPSETKISIGVEYPLGTYKVSISTSSTLDTSIAQCHFGLWGTDKSVYQRTETVSILGGGVWPGGSLNILVRNALGVFPFNATVAADMNGTFLAKWRIPNNAATGSDDIFVDGLGIFDDSKQDFFSRTSFTVTAATLLISLRSQPQSVYQRTNSATIDFLVTYPDNSPVTSFGGEGKPATLMNGPIVVTRITPVLTDSVNGVWRAAWEIPVNASLGSEYRFELTPQSFDDGFKNIGGSDRITSDTFQIVPAVLEINIQTNQSAYQVAFDSIKVRSLITYPSGTVLRSGKVSLRIIHGTLNMTVAMKYDNLTGFWYATRPLTLLELSQIGTWRLTIEANDGIGNAGVASQEVSVQPWFMVLAVICLIVVIFILVRGLQWFGRKRWRRILSGAKNLPIPFRKPETTQ